MKKEKLWVVLGVFLLFLIPLILAENLNTGTLCITDEDCIVEPQCELSECVCDQTCHVVLDSGSEETTTDTATNTTSTTNATAGTTTSTTKLDSDVALLKTQVQSLKNKVATLEGNYLTLQQDITEFSSSVQSLGSQQNQVKTNLESKVGGVSTGLAGLQEEVDTTKETVAEVEEDLASVLTFRNVMIFILLVLVIMMVAYYVTHHKRKHADMRIINYITSHIRQGKKFPHIKDMLLRAGWKESDIKTAYSATVKKNYQNYLKKKIPGGRPATKKVQGKMPGKVPSKGSGGKKLPPDKKKIIAIVVVSVLLLIGGFFIVKEATGQAIFYEKLVDGVKGGKSGIVTYNVSCTPPHIVTPTGDGCCLDKNTNGICDYTDEQNFSVIAAGEACVDNKQCSVGQFCINSKCAFLDSIYKQDLAGCSKQCQPFYALKISTNDDETYATKPGQGSYTGFGSLEWKIVKTPKHCKTENAVVPISIIKKNIGQIVTHDVITLKRGETSSVLTHPNITSVAFTLTVDKVFELCDE